MAEDELQTTDPTIDGEPTDDQKSGKKLLLIIAGIIGLFVVITSVILILLFISDDETGAIRGTAEEKEYVDEYNRRMQDSLEPVHEPVFTEPFIYTVNMKNGRNYVHVKMVAVLKDVDAKTYLEARTPFIDDTMITLLKGKAPEDLKTRAGLDLLKLEFYQVFNGLFPQEFIEQSISKDRTPVKEILINEFYIQ